MPSIFDLVNANEIGSYVEQQPVQPYLGATLFPAKQQLGLDLSWLKRKTGLPIALKPAAFDAKAPVRDRIGFSDVQTEMPFFRESMRIGERDRQELLRFEQNNQNPLVDALIRSIFDDVTNLVNGANVQPERMIMQLLSTGKIAINANRQAFEYDYHLSDEHQESLTDTAKWSDTENSTPIQDIIKWQDKVEEDTGSRPTRAIMTRKTWGYLLANKSIKLDLNPIGGQNVIMTDSLLQQYFSSKLGLTIARYNNKFVAEDGSKKNFFPDDVITLIPGSGNLGNTYYGTTPEQADLASGNTDAQVRVVNTGVAVTTYKEPHPVNVVTVVSEIVLPSFESLDQIFIANV
ncbi:major capsid protein [Sporolactobacillus terrae]|uniref:major capsid protein n=1 Tax=Sporolactobacillus terrae TaxID=269673 RepID=UPI000491FC63|nr:major capsid protein [Sporolactobacillus terrae]